MSAICEIKHKAIQQKLYFIVNTTQARDPSAVLKFHKMTVTLAIEPSFDAKIDKARTYAINIVGFNTFLLVGSNFV